jgi:hypothetical protein
MDKLNVGTAKHPILLAVREAVMLAEMGDRITYIILRTETVNALMNRGLVKPESTLWCAGNQIRVTLTSKGLKAKTRMRKNIFGVGRA